MTTRQAVILAGGLGTRLRPLTYDIPKPMMPVGDKPFLEHQLMMLKGFGIDRILLLTGYLGNQIEEHFGDGSAFGLHIEYSQEPSPLGTGGALRYAQGKLDERFLLLYGDSYLPIDYGALALQLQDNPTEAITVAYDNKEDTNVPANLAIDGDGRVLLYQKDGSDPRLLMIDAGVLALRRKTIISIEAGEAFSLENTLFPALIAKGALGSYITSQRFYDIGTPSRLSDLRSFLA